MRIDQASADAAIASLNGSRNGLSGPEAARRLREFGPNRVEPPRRDPLPLRFFRELTHFFAIVLWIAAALAFFGEWRDPGQGMARIGFAIVVVIVVSATFSFWQEHRAERTLDALQRLLPPLVQVLRDGAVTQAQVLALVPGDVVLLAQGDNVPADCRLIEAFAVRVNNATVTGESVPLARDTEPSEAERMLDARNLLFAGTSIVSGRARALVFATGMRTEFGSIARLVQSSGAGASPLRREIAQLSRLIASLAVAIGVALFALGAAIGVPPWQGFLFAIGIIVAMVPEGLLPTLTLALVLATQRMAKRNVLVRHLPAVEALGATTVICTDKTGTLTQNRMTVRKLFVGGKVVAVCDTPLPVHLVREYEPLFAAAALCHDVEFADGAPIGDPMEVSLLEMARCALGSFSPPPRLDERPFDADRMRLSTVHGANGAATLYCKGAPESVLPLCTRHRVAGEARPLDGGERHGITAAQEAMAEEGLRVLALAYRPLAPDERNGDLERDLVFAGLAAFDDPPRRDVPDAIRKCTEAGIRVVMVTGDHPRTACAVARAIGLVRGVAPVTITGDALRRMSATQLQLALDAPEVVFARASADDKRRIVEALIDKGHVVAVTGDGVNDAPALKRAHIGVAMGRSGTDVAKESADMVLLDDNFASIVDAVEEGRAVFDNIRKFLAYILTHNVAELVPYLAFVLLRVPLALTPIQVLCIDMGTDSLTALGLGVERPNPDVMRQPPRPVGEPLLNAGLALRAYLFLGLIEAAAGMAAFFFVLDRGGWRYGETLAPAERLYVQATTACLAAIIAMQVANVFLCRSALRSLRATGIRGNALIVWGVALEIVLIALIAYTPAGNALVATAPIGWDVWLFVLPFAVGMVVLEEARKALARRALARRER